MRGTQHLSPHKTYLIVPYAEKERAKALGAQWDPKIKAWFVPPDRALWSFVHWLPEGDLKKSLEAHKEQEAERQRATKDWFSLPARNLTPQEMIKLLGQRPVKRSGFCGLCDTNTTNEWCFEDSKLTNAAAHVGHWIERVGGPLRPSEWKLLLEALEKNRV